jgi:hypothetical protein
VVALNGMKRMMMLMIKAFKTKHQDFGVKLGDG